MTSSSFAIRRCRHCRKRIRLRKDGTLCLHRVKGGGICKGTHR